jgi:hypothetical protein
MRSVPPRKQKDFEGLKRFHSEVTICGAPGGGTYRAREEKPNDFKAGTDPALSKIAPRNPNEHTEIHAMPTNTHPTSRFAAMSAAQVIAAQQKLLAQYAIEDASRRARNAAILAAL